MGVNESRWAIPPRDLVLENDQVHVWRASLDIPTSRLIQLETTLSIDERERADRFYFKKDRDHYVVARGSLRALLGHYLEMDPGRFHFRYSPYGKPELVEEFNHDDIRFNISHSAGMGLFSFSKGRDIGVDIEYVREELADEQIAIRFFSTTEVEALLALPKNQQKEAFFTCWTRKEAYIKARGEGLSLPLDQFDVSLSPGEAAELLGTRPDPGEAARWSLHELVPGKGYVAAVAVRAHKLQLKCWQWSDWKIELS